jgi:hypothetical protein
LCLAELDQTGTVAGGLGRVPREVLDEARRVGAQALAVRSTTRVDAQAHELGPELALFGRELERPAAERGRERAELFEALHAGRALHRRLRPVAKRSSCSGSGSSLRFVGSMRATREAAISRCA